MVPVLIGILFAFSSPALLRHPRLIARGGVLVGGILVIGGGGTVDGFNTFHTGKKAQIKIMPDQAGDVPYTCADVSKAYHLLGYKSKVPFDTGIMLTAQWYAKAYEEKNLDVCPETQANGLGRAPSFADLSKSTTTGSPQCV